MPTSKSAQTYLGKRHDSQETEAESERSIPVENMSDDGEGCEDEEDIEPGAEDKVSERSNPAGLALCFDEFNDVLNEGEVFL